MTCVPDRVEGCVVNNGAVEADFDQLGKAGEELYVEHWLDALSVENVKRWLLNNR